MARAISSASWRTRRCVHFGDFKNVAKDSGQNLPLCVVASKLTTGISSTRIEDTYSVTMYTSPWLSSTP